MKLMVASDLHFEFHKDYGIEFIKNNFYEEDYDVLVLAGDIQIQSRLESTMKELSKIGKPIVFVPGNHEYYYSSFPEMSKTMISLKEISNIYPLDNSLAIIEGVRFIGSTLWVNHSGYPENSDKFMNCFVHIENLTSFLGSRNKESINYLDSTIQENDVVITHHLPHNDCVNSKYLFSPLNKYYLCHLGPIVEDRGAKVWIHGHSHESMDQMIGRTRVVRNPFGYIGLELNLNFSKKIIEI